jgi:Leucine-rich repeat (LRR) protein
VPEEITLCKYLRELDVAGNQLTTLPADIGQLRFLRVLRANNNLITEVPTALSYLQVRTHDMS